jgi:hypothetical protein
MATYNRPGVFVNELPLAAAPINGALAATAAGAVIGAFPQGPDTVTLVTSWYDFVKKFGGYSATYPATFSVGSFFKNGGTELYVKRVMPNAARKVAKVAVPAAAISGGSAETAGYVTFAAKHRGIDGNNIRVMITESRSTRLSGYYDISVYYEAGVADTFTSEVSTGNYATGNYSDDVLVEQFNAVTFTDTTSGDYVVSVLNFGSDYIKVLSGSEIEYATSGLPTNSAVVTAATSGTAYSGSAVTGLTAASNGTQITYTGTNTFASGQTVTITGFSTAAFNLTNAVINTAVSGSFTVLNTLATASASGTGTATFVPTVTYTAANAFSVGQSVTVSGLSTSAFNLSGVTIATASSTQFTVANSATGTVTGALASATVPTTSYAVGISGRTPVVGKIYPLAGAPSPEVALTYGDYTGNYYTASPLKGYDPAAGSGTFSVDDCANFTEFERIDRPLVFFLPDVVSKIATASNATTGAGWPLAKFVYNALIDWVEAPKTDGRHFIVVETDGAQTVSQALTSSGDLTETSRAAVYYPHIYIKDQLGRSSAAVRKIGPSGSVAGLFLDTDRKVGPFKAPAGIQTQIVDALAIERAFSSVELDQLNSGGTNLVTQNVVNAIRNVPGAGIVVMGGRTLKQDGTANRYINMRRSLTYLEKRLNDLASFAVFENNTERLWARLITSIGTFLNDYRNQGGLRGTSVEQSFYIKCDAENNTATTIAAGEVHVEVGVALEYPAEFVVINLSQKTAE